MGIAIAAAIGAAVLVLALFLLKAFWGSDPGRSRTGTGGEGAKLASVCPLCSSALGAGERIKSDIFPGKGDRIMRIFGCPHCLSPAGGALRLCPVCGGAIQPGGWAVARYFERPGRRHVHVLGCGSCHPAGGGAGRST